MVGRRGFLDARNRHVRARLPDGLGRGRHGYGAVSRQMRMPQVVLHTVGELLRLAVVPVLHRAVVAGDARVHLGLLVAARALVHLAGDVAVVLAHRIRG